MAKSPDPIDKREDDVMRRLIATKPKPHPKPPSAKKAKKPKRRG
jgi:hypothetical protein